MLYPSVCRRFVAFFFLSTSFALANYAQPGSLDRSFGRGDGYVQHGFTAPGDWVDSTAIQPDGKIVVAGGSFYIRVSRYNADGSPDRTFNRTGDVGIEITDSIASASAVALQADGKILICGRAMSVRFFFSTRFYEYNSFIMRLNADGSRDETFGIRGQILIPHGQIGRTLMNSMAVTPEGKIVVAGITFNRILLLRFNSDGSPDTTFEAATNAPSTETGAWANTVVLAPDGKIVVGGCRFLNSVSKYLAVRYHPNGALDLTLNGTGMGGEYAPGCVSSLELEPDGDMLLSGDNLTERIKSTGPRDTSFNEVGYMYLGGQIKRQSDGKILMLKPGSPGPGQPTGLIIRRFLDDGKPDTSFGDPDLGHIVYTRTTSASGLVIRDDGRFLVIANGPPSMLQYMSDGSPDPTFGSQGVAYETASVNNSTVAEVFSLADGKTLAAGGHGLMRFREDGELDTTFGEFGKVTAFDTVEGFKRGAAAMHSDGKIVVGMDILVAGGGDGFRRIRLRRFLSNGSPDVTFGSGGQVDLSGGFEHNVIGFIKIRPDGKIVIAGTSGQIGGTTKFVLFRLNENGSHDLAFGIDGIASHSNVPFGDLDLQTDGKVLVVGTTGIMTSSVFRFLENGTFDPTFGNLGSASLPLWTANTIALQPDGKILIGGAYSPPYRHSDFGVTRLNADGTIDSSFAANGLASTPVTDDFDEVNAIKVLADGRILVTGYAGHRYGTFLENERNFGSIRLTSSGGLDHNWGSNGIAIADLVGGDTPYAMDIDQQGRVIVGGESRLTFTVARFLSARTTFSVSGRVVDPAMRGIRAASVVLTDSQGISRAVTTSTFGYFAFENVPSGTFTLSVNSRRYRFSSQKLSVADDLTDLLLEGSE